MGEKQTYAQFLPNTSRIDYLSAMTYTHAFVGRWSGRPRSKCRAAPSTSASLPRS